MTPPPSLALVTGASSGIGLELARVLAREGHDLVLVARREPALRDLADELHAQYGTKSTVVRADLSQPNGPTEVHAAVAAADLEVGILVNNAGLGGHGRFTERSAEADLEILTVNIVALTQLTKLFLPAMVERRSGRVMNVASTAAFQPGPFMAVYYASKAYVLSFTEALAEEVSGTGVTVTALCPGPVTSGFQEVAGLANDAPLVKAPSLKTADFVAEAGYSAMMRGRRIEIPGLVNKVGVQSLRLSPRRAVVSVVRRLQPPS